MKFATILINLRKLKKFMKHFETVNLNYLKLLNKIHLSKNRCFVKQRNIFIKRKFTDVLFKNIK